MDLYLDDVEHLISDFSYNIFNRDMSIVKSKIIHDIQSLLLKENRTNTVDISCQIGHNIGFLWYYDNDITQENTYFYSWGDNKYGQLSRIETREDKIFLKKQNDVIVIKVDDFEFDDNILTNIKNNS